MKKICVVGSLNIDFVIKTKEHPAVGETVHAKSFKTFYGGKGGNQAMALGKLEADVKMVGVIGSQYEGNSYVAELDSNNVGIEMIDIRDDISPGIAFIPVDDEGNNTIYVCEGANGCLDMDFIDKHWDRIIENDIFLLQLEISTAVNMEIAKRLKALGKTVILDPAPAANFEPALYPYIDYLTPNETELVELTGFDGNIKNEDIEECIRALESKMEGKVIAKAGEQGAFIVVDGALRNYPALKVDVVDTTAAGDSFNAGFAYGLSIGKSFGDAIGYGITTASLAVTKMGAQSGMPNKKELRDAMK